MPLAAVVLFSHGSLLCGSGQILQLHAQRLRESGDYLLVEPGYLNYSSPPIEEAVEKCAAAGAEQIIIVPYFLVAGKFVVEDLPARIQTVTKAYPHLRFSVARAIEDASQMVDAIWQTLSSATSPTLWQQNAIVNSQHQCERKATCPLFGSALCQSQGAIQ